MVKTSMGRTNVPEDHISQQSVAGHYRQQASQDDGEYHPQERVSLRCFFIERESFIFGATAPARTDDSCQFPSSAAGRLAPFDKMTEEERKSHRSTLCLTSKSALTIHA
jgi:hypothetical protein